MVTAAPDHLVFGYGRHACPGRFFALAEIKLILAHMILTYDIKLENDVQTPPPAFWFGYNVVQDSKTKVLFRARAT